MNKKEVVVKVFPVIGNIYKVVIEIDTQHDEEEQVDIWIEENLKNVDDWEWG